MPIISSIGSRTLKVRLTYGIMYAVLSVGALTMIYPLLLMLAGSIKSEVDFSRLSPWPEYLWNDDVLWAKYVQSKYGKMADVERWQRVQYGSWQLVTPPPMKDVEIAQQFRKFRATKLPIEFYQLGHAEWQQVVAKNGRAFRRAAQEMSGGSIEKYSSLSGFFHEDWSKVGPPLVDFAARRFTFPHTVDYQIYYDVKAAVPPADRVMVDLDATFVHQTLMIQWPDIGTDPAAKNYAKSYNASHGTHFQNYDEVTLDTHPPADGQRRKDWETYVRNELNLAYIRISPSARPALQSYLREKYENHIADFNSAWQLTLTGFDQIDLPQPMQASLRASMDLSSFVKDPEACPLDALSVFGVRQAFEEWIAQRKDPSDLWTSVRRDSESAPTSLPAEVRRPVIIPTRTIDYLDFQEQKSSLRWEFLKRNYLTVFDFLLVHGNGIRNTIIFCALMVLTNLLVNPLAAYALSRYRPPSTYAILLFCMATMAFPAEVTMIPSFLLLKNFPVFSLFSGIATAAIILWLWRGTSRSTIRILLAVAAGIAVGWWLTPLVVSHLSGGESTVSLLNTFWALVLPGMANGFSIFLLKGFFDSLPRELYEAADLDGANEWTKFWTLTMNLSKPILAVLALSAFTAAYSEFMMALVIIPDQKMWTIMVWLFRNCRIGLHPHRRLCQPCCRGDPHRADFSVLPEHHHAWACGADGEVTLFWNIRHLMRYPCGMSTLAEIEAAANALCRSNKSRNCLFI